ncbi:hydroxymethylbilane synthase [Weizmannia coagulans]|jgi:hydroxymethylbilane synthase|uniref:Porphobilinogen deaminase n=3 Tax=Heyndrickxia TaxID=2837504 RepID=G2TKU4_HEYCO|nr:MULTISPECIES: hydroxymethylbilane synthase [Heyndrickxia]AEP01793.1 porphobilinogen deaminase [Heyndrickxia coagulans 36D1]AJO22386.1 porphobilinogen deaminase [Heyndrickxia coagulans]AKN56082.1 Porphobilinogen deaminase [Heyndrickxia coagulans]APB36615.1 hydroxymethylbilane synthase [Heyndrickxia coagulans]ATW82715.1 hydroxymethylbilane synthase [Heyndrickxia coagulans]
MRTIVVGSRRSKLALTQTKWVVAKLEQLGLPFRFEIREITTKGDKVLDVTLSKVGGKGLFVKEIEDAMLNHEIDMAVHSMKDVPAVLPDGLVIGCIPEREDVRDALISKNGTPFSSLKEGAVVGTSSLRRGAQLLAVRSDIRIKSVRGNIDTRLEKLKNGDYDAIVLAAAGLKRMGWSADTVTEFFDPDICLPAIGQGALAVECRADDGELLDALRKLDSAETAETVKAERVFLDKMEGGCQVPIAGLAKKTAEGISLTALVASPDGKTVYKETVVSHNPVTAGEKAADILSRQGAKALIEQVKAELGQS